MIIKINKRTFTFCLVYVLSSLWLTACQTSLETTGTPTQAMEATMTPQIDQETAESGIAVVAYPTSIPTLVWTPALQELRASFLGEPCSAPCWFGIEPDVTSLEEALIILDQLQEEGMIQGFYVVERPDYLRYVLQLHNGFSGALGIDKESEFVLFNSFGGISSSGRLLTLGDVISAYAEPNKVAYAAGKSYEGVRLAYPDRNLILTVQSDKLGGSQMITSDMAVSDYDYFTSDDTEATLNFPGITWVDWDGYNTFSYYYQKFREAELNN